MLHYIDHKFKDGAGPFAKFVMKCCQCCLWCLEKCLKYVGKNAYVECLIHGYSFCNAAVKSFESLLSNIVLVAAVNGLAFMLLTMAKVAVTCVCVLCGCKNDDPPCP